MKDWGIVETGLRNKTGSQNSTKICPHNFAESVTWDYSAYETSTRYYDTDDEDEDGYWQCPGCNFEITGNFSDIRHTTPLCTVSNKDLNEFDFRKHIWMHMWYPM